MKKYYVEKEVAVVAPRTYEGKELRYEETFVSPFVRPTIESAKEVLTAIRDAHSSEYGWVEFGAWIEEAPNGNGYIAVRHHAQYK